MASILNQEYGVPGRDGRITKVKHPSQRLPRDGQEYAIQMAHVKIPYDVASIIAVLPKLYRLASISRL